MRSRRLAKGVAVLGGATLALGLAEVALRLLPAPGFHVFEPRRAVVLRPPPGLMIGIDGEARMIANSQGLRANEPPRGSAYRVLAVGGSTTECQFLDHTETWTQLLEQRLAAGGRQVFVANAGKSGLNTRDHVLELDCLLGQYPDFDAVVLMTGINDLGHRLAHDAGDESLAWRGAPSDAAAYQRIFRVVPDELRFGSGPAGWSRVVQRARRWWSDRAPEAVSRMRGGWTVVDHAGLVLARWRYHRSTASKLRASLPELGPALDDFRSNLREAAERVRRRGKRLVLVTQGAIWRKDLPRELEPLLWMGGVGRFQEAPGHEYYTPGALADGLERWNAVVLETARELRVEGVDLAPKLPKDTSSFYDDCHLNENGGRRVAEVLAEHFSTHGALAAPR